MERRKLGNEPKHTTYDDDKNFILDVKKMWLTPTGDDASEKE